MDVCEAKGEEDNRSGPAIPEMELGFRYGPSHSNSLASPQTTMKQ